MTDQKSHRFLIKKSIDALRVARPVPPFLVVDNQEAMRQTCFFVWGVRARQVETTDEHHTQYSMSLFTSDDIDVQLAKGDEFISAAVALESGKARFETWEPAYRRAGFFDDEATPVLIIAIAK